MLVKAPLTLYTLQKSMCISIAILIGSVNSFVKCTNQQRGQKTQGGGSMAPKKRQHWYSVYRAIAPRISGYEGSASIYEVMREEANSAGYDEKILKRILNAGAFLTEVLAPENLSEDLVKCGYTHIEILERLYKLDAPLAIKLSDKVLANLVTLKQLNSDLASVRDKGGQVFASARSSARQRINDHRRLSIDLIAQAGAGFFGNPDAEMVLVHRFRSLGQFVLLNDPERPIAVIPRIGDSSLKPAKAADLLLQLAIAHKIYFDRIWLILPEDSELAQEVVAQAVDMKIFENWLFLATPNEDQTALEHYQNRAQVLVKKMFGEDDHRWDGVSMVDGRELFGSLKPV